MVINWQVSRCTTILAGVPQGSVLGPLLFLLFINDISSVVRHCKICRFMDNTCLFIEVDNTDDKNRQAVRQTVASHIDEDLENIQNWADSWIVTFSSPKTKSLTISNKKDVELNPKLHLNGHEIEEVKQHTYLGLKIFKT